MSNLKSFAVAAALGALTVTQTLGTTITFNEGLPSLTILDGNPFYDSFGVSFENSLLFGPDLCLPDDGWGIANESAAGMFANFANAQSLVSFTWVTAGEGVNFHARAFDSGNNLVDSFDFIDVPGGGSVNGVASLTGPGIVRVSFSDGESLIAVDTLTFEAAQAPVGVPDPANTFTLMGLAMTGLIAFRRRLVAQVAN
jgi:hypothetical protein